MKNLSVPSLGANAPKLGVERKPRMSRDRHYTITLQVTDRDQLLSLEMVGCPYMSPGEARRHAVIALKEAAGVLVEEEAEEA